MTFCQGGPLFFGKKSLNRLYERNYVWYLFPDVILDIGIPFAPETTEAVFASFTSYWNICLNALLFVGVAAPFG